MSMSDATCGSSTGGPAWACVWRQRSGASFPSRAAKNAGKYFRVQLKPCIQVTPRSFPTDRKRYGGSIRITYG